MMKRLEGGSTSILCATATAALARTQTEPFWFWFWAIISGAYLACAVGMIFWNAYVETVRSTGCYAHPVPGRPCQAPGPHEIARGATGCVFCGKEINP